MNTLISAVILASCIAGLLFVLINLTMKFIVFMAKAIAKEPCSINIVGELVFAFIFSFFIVFYALFFI